MDVPFFFLPRKPGPTLAPYVELVWYARGTVPYDSEQVAPTGSSVAIFVLGDPLEQTPHGGPAVATRSIAELAQEEGVSHAHFTRGFSRHVGLTPRVFGRIMRLQRLLTIVDTRHGTDWAGAASQAATQLANILAATGGSVQQHATEVRDAGLSKHREILNHFKATLGLTYGNANLLAHVGREHLAGGGCLRDRPPRRPVRGGQGGSAAHL